MLLLLLVLLVSGGIIDVIDALIQTGRRDSLTDRTDAGIIGRLCVRIR
jgi:hypothetical protein